jgi:hypothetical protein
MSGRPGRPQGIGNAHSDMVPTPFHEPGDLASQLLLTAKVRR